MTGVWAAKAPALECHPNQIAKTLFDFSYRWWAHGRVIQHVADTAGAITVAATGAVCSFVTTDSGQQTESCCGLERQPVQAS